MSSAVSETETRWGVICEGQKKIWTMPCPFRFKDQ